MNEPWIVSRRGRISSALMVVLLSASSAIGREWFVEPDAPGGFTIQAAIDAASPDDIVILRPGTYTWTAQRPAEHSMVRLAPGITLRGEGGAAATVLDGEGLGRLIVGVDCGARTSIEGLSIRNGIAPIDHVPPYVPANGAGVFFDESSDLFMRDCILQANRLINESSYGAGVCCYRGTLFDCTIADNTGMRNCAGIGVISFESLVMERCVVRGHSAAFGDPGSPGAGTYAFGTAVITDCVFESNSTYGIRSSWGAALAIRLGGTVRGCRFENNRVETSPGWEGPASGGAIAVVEGHTLIADCVFAGNEAASSGFPGTGAAVAAVSVNATLEVRGCTFIENHSLANGAVLPDAPAIACILARPENVQISNCIFARNEGQAVRDGVATYCCAFFGNTHDAQTGGSDNIFLDPLFCATDPVSAHDFSVSSLSPCRPGGNGTCGLIGAAVVGCQGVAVQSKTWTDVKQLYR